MTHTQETITSPTNPRIRQLVRLRKRREREAGAQTLVVGRQAVTCAARAGAMVQELYLCPELAGEVPTQDIPAGCSVTLLARAAYEKACYGEWNDGWLAVVRPPSCELDALQPGSNPFMIVAAGLEKPGNLGAIVRSADACRVDGVLACDCACDPFNPNAIRASLGTTFSVPLALADSSATLAWLRARDITIVVATPEAPTLYWDADLTKPTAIVVGGEHPGVDRLWKENAQLLVSLPMRGRADSLNVSNSAAILMYEVLRQRRPRR